MRDKHRQHQNSERYPRNQHNRDRDQRDRHSQSRDDSHMDNEDRGWDTEPNRPVDEQYSRHQSRGTYEPEYRSGPGYNDHYGDNQEHVRDSRFYGGSQRNAGGYGSSRQSMGSSEFQDSGSRQSNSYKGQGPKGYKRSDERIKEDICERLSDDHDIDAQDITVEVDKGEVQLKGTVENRQAKRSAEDCCEQVSGVTDVMNQLKVNASNVHKLSDRSEGESNEQNQKKRQASK